MVRKTINRLDRDVETGGLQPAMHNLAKSFGTDIEVYKKDEDLDSILKNDPVLVAANHPAEADVVALLASLSQRKDIYIVINSCFLQISPNLDKHLIPVYISHHLIRKDKPNFRFRLFKLIHKFPCLSEDEEHAKNIESIKMAGQKLKEGGLVVIFPGGGGEGGRWFSGIGHILNEARETKNLHFVKAYIRGTSDKDYLRLIPGLARFLPRFNVTFSRAKLIGEFKSIQAKEITRELENDFNDWANTESFV